MWEYNVTGRCLTQAGDSTYNTHYISLTKLVTKRTVIYAKEKMEGGRATKKPKEICTQRQLVIEDEKAHEGLSGKILRVRSIGAATLRANGKDADVGRRVSN